MHVNFVEQVSYKSECCSAGEEVPEYVRDVLVCGHEHSSRGAVHAARHVHSVHDVGL
jgi:hypothetical protein